MSSSDLDSGICSIQNQSSPFSISDILSSEMGQKKSPTSRLGSFPFAASGCSSSFSTPGTNSYVNKVSPYAISGQDNANYGSLETPKRPRKSSNSHISARTPQIRLSEAGTLVTSSSSPAYTGHHENFRVHGSYVTHVVTPHKPLRPSQINSSIISPFNFSVLSALGQRPSPSSEVKEDLFGENSLGMLSEVAQYHSELSGTNANSSIEVPMQEKLANIRLVSTCDGCDDRVLEASKEESSDAAVRKILTPSILKRDKKQQRASSCSTAPSSSGDESNTSSRYNHTHLNTGFLSPLADEKSSAHNKELTFSPSIFLSRPDHPRSISSPDHTHNTAPSPSSLIPIPKPETGTSSDPHQNVPPNSLYLSSPGSESDCPHSLSESADTDSGSFATSTPIKSGKENVVRERSEVEEKWSPTILLNKRRRHLRENNEPSSGSESDAVKKPCLPAPRRRKSKARTKLSPLLENACSPISKDSVHHHHPSPLTTALATTPTRGLALGVAYQIPSSSNSGTLLPLSDHLHTKHPQPLAIPSPALAQNCPTFSGTIGGASFSQRLLLSSTTPISLNPSFSAAATPSTVPISLPPTAHISQQTRQNLLLQQNALSQLQPPFAYNPLVSMCNTSALCGYGNIVPSTAGTIPGAYLPFMNLVAPTPPNTATYLPYSSYPPSMHHLMAFNKNSCEIESSSSGRSSSSQVSIDEEKRDKKQLQSVPPWFIFSNNRSEKRSRLTDAINKSLSETPSQPTTKLPAEWTKLACGQTNDQKMLTEKARMFMQCRPRQLSFTDE